LTAGAKSPNSTPPQHFSKRIEEDKVVFFHLTGECEKHAATKTTLPPS
jgi:hypothetical protein